jgi:adenylate cyclase
VFANHGVLIDYIGDELMAMWGAPVARGDHAELACCAALDMIDRLEELDTRWSDLLGEPMRIGIGLNSGEAHVGVTGSRQRFKYGPLGPNVNIASRVQGASKYLKTSLLMTQRTLDFMQDRSRFSIRRLCTAKVVNIEEQIPLFEVQRPTAESSTLFRQYETALALFEKGRLSEASRLLGGLLANQHDDGPSQLLMSRVLSAIVSDGSDFDPVWIPPGK